jgi:hypothetical protein
VGHGLQQDERNLDYLRSSVGSKSAQLASLQSQLQEARQESFPLEKRMAELNAAYDLARSRIEVAVANQQQANLVISAEILRDLALEAGADRLREHIDRIAGSAGLSARLPANTRDAIFDFARRGGHVVLPVKGYEAQWDAFTEVQKETLDILDRAQGYMTEAAQLAASGSPTEMDQFADRVFSSVRWHAVEVVRKTGFSSVPEGEDRSVIEDLLDRYITKRKEHGPDS